MIQKAAPGRLARAILALAVRRGKKIGQVLEADHIDRGEKRLPKRTTVTVETETLLIVRSERTTSSSSWEANAVPRDPNDDRRGKGPSQKGGLHAAYPMRGAAADETKTNF